MMKKGQAQSIIIFFGLMIAVFIVAIIVLRVTNTIITPFQNQIGNVSAPAGAAVGYVHTRFTAWWDYAIILVFLFNVILLLVSAFLVDIHPAFVLIYIIAIVFMFIFGNYALSAVDAIWGGMGTSVETAQTPITQFLLNNFQMIMLGIVILSGIVMYAKFKMFAGQGGGGNS
jgi:hypothetical protein